MSSPQIPSLNCPRSTVRLLSPAKVNLSLRIVGRRPDGYHLIDSITVPISLYDELVVGTTLGATDSQNPAVRMTSNADAAPGGPTNLAYRAAAAFVAAVGRIMTVSIDLDKRIPIGSGLGGGSSDAATVLLALNRLCGRPLALPRLLELATAVGADVPFFVQGRAARVRGIGERVAPLVDPCDLVLVVCWDRRPLSTQAVYAGFDASLTTVQPLSNIATSAGSRGPYSEVLVNDLEAAAARIHPGILAVKARLLDHGAMGALMSGSGSAVFGVWPDWEGARATAERLRTEGLWAEAVRTLAVSPAVSE